MSDYSTKDYNRGWRASMSGSEWALDRADLRGECVEWYDGYMDAASDRPKFFLRDHPEWDESTHGDWESYLRSVA
ncbi:hypothetical protein ACU4IU_00220 [Brevibacterium sp. CSND-B09]|uniref:hypothetical protein n=1 Tax=Brevibacterium sp. CSND-B09 TaxID=3462571 RepID=UPI00406A5F31